MAKCDVCGRSETMPYHCRYCGGTHCSSHRLPENHNCTGLENWNDPGGIFDSGFDSSIQTTSSQTNSLGSIVNKLNFTAGVGGPLGYFRGNLSYLFLAIIWVTFFLQWSVILLFPNTVFEDLFVLSTSNPLYVWTWVTSIFAHGSFSHVVINSIVLYFFGPLVERRVTPKAFVALFMLSGIAAGLSQIAAAIILGESSGVVGASGAIMAIMGVLTVLNPNLRVYLFFILPMPLWLLTIGFAIYSVFIAFGAGIGAGQVAHLAHLVGLVIGLVYGEKLRREGQRLPGELRLGPGGPGGQGRRRF